MCYEPKLSSFWLRKVGRKAGSFDSELRLIFFVLGEVMSDILSAKLETERRVIKIVSSYFSVDVKDIEFGLRLIEDLYVDSMGLVEIVMVLNESFGIELPEAGVRKWRTVGDVCWLVECVVEDISR